MDLELKNIVRQAASEAGISGRWITEYVADGILDHRFITDDGKEWNPVSDNNDADMLVDRFGLEVELFGQYAAYNTPNGFMLIDARKDKAQARRDAILKAFKARNEPDDGYAKHTCYCGFRAQLGNFGRMHGSGEWIPVLTMPLTGNQHEVYVCPRCGGLS